MSKFLRKMERMSAKPEDFKSSKTVTTVVTVPTVVTKPTVAKVTTVVPVRARNVQHAHTVWEQQLYEALWKEASPVGQEYRELSMGYRHIAALTGLSLRTVQRNMKYLEQKFALEPVGRYDPDTKTPKTYRIYSYREILARRREAGKEWVIINRQGVELVGSSAGAESQEPPSSTTVATVTTVATKPTATVAKVTTADSRHGDDSFRAERKESSQPSSSGVLIVIDKVRKYLAVDDDVVRMVIRQCRRNDPECTHEEIAEFAAVSAAKIARQRNVDNPAGLLISQVPKFFPGSELQTYRVRKARELAESKEVARKVLDDPESAQDARDWAQAVLADSKG